MDKNVFKKSENCPKLSDNFDNKEDELQQLRILSKDCLMKLGTPEGVNSFRLAFELMSELRESFHEFLELSNSRSDSFRMWHSFIF